MKIYVLETKQIFADKDNSELIYKIGDLLAIVDSKRKDNLVKRGLAEVLGVLDTSSDDVAKNKGNESTDNHDDTGNPEKSIPADNQDDKKTEDPKENPANKDKPKNSNSKK